MDYRSTHAVDRRRDPRERQWSPCPVTADRADTGPNMTEEIHGELFPDYKPTTGPR